MGLVHCLCWNPHKLTLKKHKSIGTEGKRADCAKHSSIVPTGPFSIIPHTVLCLKNMTCMDCINRLLLSRGCGHWRDPENTERKASRDNCSPGFFLQLSCPCPWTKTTDHSKQMTSPDIPLSDYTNYPFIIPSKVMMVVT